MTRRSQSELFAAQANFACEVKSQRDGRRQSRSPPGSYKSKRLISGWAFLLLHDASLPHRRTSGRGSRHAGPLSCSGKKEGRKKPAPLRPPADSLVSSAKSGGCATQPRYARDSNSARLTAPDLPPSPRRRRRGPETRPLRTFRISPSSRSPHSIESLG